MPVYILSMATCCYSGDGVAAAKTVWPAKLEVFSVWPFTEEVCHSARSWMTSSASTCPSSLILWAPGLSPYSSLFKGKAQFRSLLLSFSESFQCECKRTFITKAQLLMVAERPHIYCPCLCLCLHLAPCPRVCHLSFLMFSCMSWAYSCLTAFMFAVPSKGMHFPVVIT